MTNATAVTNELQLIESKEVREQHIEKVEVLNKVKELVMLSNDTHVTVEMVSNYYEVDIKTIEKNIERNKEELLSDGLLVLKGKQLTDFKSECQIQSRASSLTIIPRRAILRIGMLLRDSQVAKDIRTYLLEVEKIAPQEIKDEAMSIMLESRESLVEMKSMMGTMFNEIKFLHNANDELKFEVIQLKNNIQTSTSETNGKIIHVDFKVDGIKEDINKFTSRINYPAITNSSRFEEVKHSFGKHFNVYGIGQYNFLYKHLENWLDIKFPQVSNMKHYVTEEDKELINIEVIEQFVHGVLIGRIIKSKAGNWVDSMGALDNEVEWRKVLRYFKNACAYCGRMDIALLFEHMVNKARHGSTNLISNCVCTCPDCNAKKNDKTVNEWIKDGAIIPKENIILIKAHYEKYILN